MKTSAILEDSGREMSCPVWMTAVHLATVTELLGLPLGERSRITPFYPEWPPARIRDTSAVLSDPPGGAVRVQSGGTRERTSPLGFSASRTTPLTCSRSSHR